jgi:NAD(P)-dependent dehydrogenase (short-subunit alcohol dehydrogenase family)
MAADGAKVGVHARSVASASAVVDEIEAKGGSAVALAADLSYPHAPGLLVRDAAAALGRLDILVNNAGGWGSVPGEYGPILEATPEGYEAVFGLNVRATLFAAIEAARIMRDQGSAGNIINLASVDGLGPTPGEALYAAAKAAVINLTGTLAYEFGHLGIRVNAVAPGVIETDLTLPYLQTENERIERASFYPINRLGTSDDVAAAIAFLCSAEASWISGATLPICGGQAATSDIFRWTRSHNPVPAGLEI